ncbi:MAG: hypothetical protein F4Z35_03100 [Dehalococcoidia bacterium]|nr:hypothetical protein [Dehalococcoidia bacterium]
MRHLIVTFLSAAVVALTIACGEPTPRPDTPATVVPTAVPACPDHPAHLTAEILPELAEMTMEQRELLYIHWDQVNGKEVRVVDWYRNGSWTVTAVLVETDEGCRAGPGRYYSGEM